MSTVNLAFTKKWQLKRNAILHQWLSSESLGSLSRRATSALLCLLFIGSFWVRFLAHNAITCYCHTCDSTTSTILVISLTNDTTKATNNKTFNENSTIHFICEFNVSLKHSEYWTTSTKSFLICCCHLNNKCKNFYKDSSKWIQIFRFRIKTGCPKIKPLSRIIIKS